MTVIIWIYQIIQHAFCVLEKFLRVRTQLMPDNKNKQKVANTKHNINWKILNANQSIMCNWS